MCKETITTKEDITPIIITHMFNEAHTNTHLDGRFSPHKNFTNALKEWCIANNKDFQVWNLSMFRVFSLHSKYPSAPIHKTVSYVLKRDKKLLQLNSKFGGNSNQSRCLDNMCEQSAVLV